MEIDNPDLFPLNGYRPLICKTRKNSQGGGVGVYIRSNLRIQYSIREDLSIFYDKVLESLVIEISDQNSKRFLVTVLYRSNGIHPTLSSQQQSSEFLMLLENMLEHISQSGLT